MPKYKPKMTVEELIAELRCFPKYANISIDIVAQSGKYTIGHLWMNPEHTEVFIHGTV